MTEPTLPEIPATPVATLPPPDVTTPVATVIDPSVTGATDPTKIESPDVSTPPPVDPTLVAEQPATTAPVDPDTVVSATSPDDGSADRQPTATAGTSDATATGARYAVGHAGAASGGSAGSGFSDGSGSNSKGDDKSSDPSVNSVQAQPAQPSMTAATQVHIAVPAEHQLAPSIGIEIATTAQGMSAVERVQQATDQAQVPTSMLKVLNVQLAPPDLGNVSVRLSLEGSAIDVHMTADQSRTRTLIERDRHVIADSLTKVGYSVNTLTIDQTSATSDSNMSSAGQSFSSNNSFDGSSGRQSNGAGEFGRPQREAGRNGGFMDADGSIPAAPPRRPGASRGVFV